MLGGSRHDAGIDLADQQLIRRRVALFDDRADQAVRVADDAAVADRIGHVAVNKASRIGVGRRQQFAQARGRDQRHIAVQHEHAMIVGDQGHRLHHGVAGAQLLGLQDPIDFRLA